MSISGYTATSSDITVNSIEKFDLENISIAVGITSISSSSSSSSSAAAAASRRFNEFLVVRVCYTDDRDPGVMTRRRRDYVS